MVLGQLYCNLHCEQRRFFSGMALFEWLVSRIFGLFIPKEKLSTNQKNSNSKQTNYVTDKPCKRLRDC